jgi:hypothetical protein
LIIGKISLGLERQTMRISALIPLVVIGLGVIATAIPSRADDDEDWGNWRQHHHHHRHYYGYQGWEGPVVVVPRSYYYAQPPVYYAPPPPAYYAPGFSFGMGVW